MYRCLEKKRILNALLSVRPYNWASRFYPFFFRTSHFYSCETDPYAKMSDDRMTVGIIVVWIQLFIVFLPVIDHGKSVKEKEGTYISLWRHAFVKFIRETSSITCPRKDFFFTDCYRYARDDNQNSKFIKLLFRKSCIYIYYIHVQ